MQDESEPTDVTETVSLAGLITGKWNIPYTITANQMNFLGRFYVKSNIFF